MRASAFPRVLVLSAALSGALAAAAVARKKPAAALATFDSPVEAMQSLILKSTPQVIAFGEFHEVEGAPKVQSSLVHFRDEVLPFLSPFATDLILETWVTQGNCGKEEAKVVAEVQETTRRPESTESELVTLITRARKVGVAPHILELTCKEYDALLGTGGEIDYVVLLSTITRLLEQKIGAVLSERKDSPEKAVLVYGGALHNDLQPRAELRRFTYAPSVQRKTKGRLLSVDLFVPEYLDRSDDMKAKPWYPLLDKVPPGKTALIRRGQSSYTIVFPRGATPQTTEPAPPPPDGGAH